MHQVSILGASFVKNGSLVSVSISLHLGRINFAIFLFIQNHDEKKIHLFEFQNKWERQWSFLPPPPPLLAPMQSIIPFFEIFTNLSLH